MTNDKSHTLAAAEFVMTDDCRVGRGGTVKLISNVSKGTEEVLWYNIDKKYSDDTKYG